MSWKLDYSATDGLTRALMAVVCSSCKEQADITVLKEGWFSLTGTNCSDAGIIHKATIDAADP